MRNVRCCRLQQIRWCDDGGNDYLMNDNGVLAVSDEDKA